MRHLLTLTLGLAATLLSPLPAHAFVDLGSAPDPGYGASASTRHRTMPHTAGRRGVVSVNLSGATDPDPATGAVAHMTQSHATAGDSTWVKGTNPIGMAEEFTVYEVTSSTLSTGTPVEVRVSWWGSWAGAIDTRFNLGLHAYQAICPDGGTCDPSWADLAFDVSWLKTPAVLRQGGYATMTHFSDSFSLDVGLKKWKWYDLWDPSAGGHWVDLEVGDQFTLYSFTDVEGYEGDASAQEHHTVHLPNATLLDVQLLPIAPEVPPAAVPEPASALLVAPLLAALALRRRAERG